MRTSDELPEDDGERSLPADKDFPRGFGESSWWPPIAAVGAAGLYSGVALFFLGHGGSSIVPAMAGPAVFLSGFALFVGGVFGWLYHAFIAGFRTRDTDEHSTNPFRLGMLLFLSTEVFTFGAGFVYYFFIRIGGWPPTKLPALLSPIVFANTIVLVVSSFTFHASKVALRKSNCQRFLRLLAVTLILGIVFITGQMYEYSLFIAREGFTLMSGTFASAFFGLTSLHGLHVTLGTILIAIILVRGFSGQYSANQHTSVSTVSMYWHFVDVVWLFLVVVIYVGGAI